MMKIFENLVRYLIVHTRRKGRLAFSSREALSLVLIVGLPFVMVSSLSINKNLHQNAAYAYASSQDADISVSDAERMGRQLAAQVKGNPAALLKLKGAQISMIFNKPGLQRHEGTMNVWQYRTNSCVLDLYVADGGRGPVVHYETRARVKASRSDDDAMDNTAARDCVRSVFLGHDGEATMVFASR